jgi:hypothetical protein
MALPFPEGFDKQSTHAGPLIESGAFLMDSSAFDQGVAAATDGLPASANPYADGTAEHEHWIDGYHSVVDHPEDIEERGDVLAPTKAASPENLSG